VARLVPPKRDSLIDPQETAKEPNRPPKETNRPPKETNRPQKPTDHQKKPRTQKKRHDQKNIGIAETSAQTVQIVPQNCPTKAVGSTTVVSLLHSPGIQEKPNYSKEGRHGNRVFVAERTTNHGNVVRFKRHLHEPNRSNLLTNMVPKDTQELLVVLKKPSLGHSIPSLGHFVLFRLLKFITWQLCSIQTTQIHPHDQRQNQSLHSQSWKSAKVDATRGKTPRANPS